MMNAFARKPRGKGKTIRMKKVHAKRWLAALELPENQKRQGTGALFQSDGGRRSVESRGYCCLGVLQQVVSGGVEKNQGYPSAKWLKENGICFINNGQPGVNPTITTDEHGNEVTASDLNDARRMPFKEIAKHLRACIQTY